MRISIIGAGGFLGQRLSTLAANDVRVTSLVLSDTAPMPVTKGVEVVTGSFTDPAIRPRICDADTVVLLASLLGGAAEHNYALARQVNLDGVMDLFEYLRDHRPGTRVVMASSIAVFGHMPTLVTDDTQPDPIMTYGGQKLMTEAALTNFTRKGWLDGISLRLSGVMARDGMDNALKTAFMSQLFWAVRRGDDFELPVSKNARTWLTSIDTAAQNFLHAATLSDLGERRAITLPALCTTFGELLDALRRAYPDSQSRLAFSPDPETEALFGRFPDLETAAADKLGFARDADADALVARAY